MFSVRRAQGVVLVVGVMAALSSCGGTELSCSGESHCAGNNNHSEGGDSSNGTKVTPPDSQSAEPSTEAAAFTTLYSDRTLKNGLPYPSLCNASVDFDEGRAWTSDTVSPDGSELDLRACYVEFGQYVNARSAGISETPKPDAEECLGYARSGGIQTISNWDEVYKEKPIKTGMTLCFETEEGNIARAEVIEATWKRYNDGGGTFHRPFYTFKVTAWTPNE
ncbi:hypothetical protein [Streptomyces sp. NBC_00724]|uniref:hypothetical protein n=1 Tax=Streptomyces sp. NBC_00724 TaxID=2975812 RepID=UPI002ED5A3EF|nr:hypothetical protein OHB17_00405 [Streptomyces sp. NBC_00724]WTI92101.1 hypothetical protein OHB17_41600 [Streptomyces sp. NBC_00724]